MKFCIMINGRTSIGTNNGSKNIVSEENITLNILDISLIEIFLFKSYIFKITCTSNLNHV